jgi:hypothetical protein
MNIVAAPVEIAAKVATLRDRIVRPPKGAFESACRGCVIDVPEIQMVVTVFLPQPYRPSSINGSAGG